jgi:hypothetical protein
MKYDTAMNVSTQVTPLSKVPSLREVSSFHELSGRRWKSKAPHP